MGDTVTQGFVSSDEMSRWMREQADFRQRLETRISGQHTEVLMALTRIELQVKETNGRTLKAEAAVSGILDRLDRVDEDDQTIKVAVQSIQSGGCSKYGAHMDLLRQNVEGWSGRKKAAVGSGLVASGVLVWPTVQSLVQGLHTVIEWISANVK